MSARVTFGNINGLGSPVPYVSLEDELVVDSQPAFTEVGGVGGGVLPDLLISINNYYLAISSLS